MEKFHTPHVLNIYTLLDICADEGLTVVKLPKGSMQWELKKGSVVVAKGTHLHEAYDNYKYELPGIAATA